MGEFTSAVIDIGLVVKDIEQSVAFYRDAVGFAEVSQFEVPDKMGGDAGLTDYRPFRVRVMQLGDTEGGTKIKLIEFADTPACPDTQFIHSVTGVRYLTVRVADVSAAVERASKAGVKPLARGPIEMPPPFRQGMGLAVVQDPDGNLVEMIGPMST